PFEGTRYGLRGTSLQQRFAPAAPCVGGIDRRRAIGTTGAAAVVGWLARPEQAELPDFVVLVDEGGVIRGLPDFASAERYRRVGLPADVLPWSGFVVDYDPAQPYAAYAVLSDGRSASPLRAP